MPPKQNRNLAKSSNGPPKITSSDATAPVSLSPELEQQFEAELCWCIQQLQTALKSGKLNNKQVQDHTKALNTLMSNNAPMIKKRQVMRLSFGDYRAKMAAEEKKCSRKALNMKVKPAIPNKNSTFIKKSTVTSSGNRFQFNFEPATTDESSKEMNNVKFENDSYQHSKDFKFLPSDNSFRFSFDINEKT